MNKKNMNYTKFTQLIADYADKISSLAAFTGKHNPLVEQEQIMERLKFFYSEPISCSPRYILLSYIVLFYVLFLYVVLVIYPLEEREKSSTYITLIKIKVLNENLQF